MVNRYGFCVNERVRGWCDFNSVECEALHCCSLGASFLWVNGDKKKGFRAFEQFSGAHPVLKVHLGFLTRARSHTAASDSRMISNCVHGDMGDTVITAELPMSI